ncbi:MAG TPA: hypothetical protein VHF47_04755 [Acidimicrobiales bacterium]|nr:hypothetical protein [Acidimicrobiales bacterium]
MRRRLAAVVALSLLGATGIAIAPPPAAAQGACAGAGILNVTSGLRYPLAPSATTAGTTVNVFLAGSTATSFAFSLGTGACTSGSLTASGVVRGYCGHSAARGTTGDGYDFAWTNVGSVAVVTGELAGLFAVTADPLSGSDCNNGATVFRLAGSVALLPCSSLVEQASTPLLVQPQQQSLGLSLVLGHVYIPHILAFYHVIACIP